ncbi:alpha/beta hydrolase [Cyanobium sp. Morenito 9A2]|nr:alpha/beta hydrolase [Cyanobium sp. Morenito 9A2]
MIGATLATVALPASAAVDNDLPVRWNSGGAVWSTNLDAFKTFIGSGDVTDRGLASGISRSGWSASELRTGLAKPYSVDLVGVSNFLYSDAGVKFLKNASRSYFPYWSQSTYAVESLRSSIIASSVDGTISSAEIMGNLPVDYRLADTCNTYDGKQNVCAEGKCVGEAQCTSLLSWYVFLPACIQANQLTGPIAAVRPEPMAAPAPAPEAIRGLW